MYIEVENKKDFLKPKQKAEILFHLIFIHLCDNIINKYNKSKHEHKKFQISC